MDIFIIYLGPFNSVELTQEISKPKNGGGGREQDGLVGKATGWKASPDTNGNGPVIQA